MSLSRAFPRHLCHASVPAFSVCCSFDTFGSPHPPSSCFCRCGRPLDVLGHHRADCAQAGVLGRRWCALESAAARVCREAGARVTTNVMVRDLDLLPLHQVDARRLEVVADGLPGPAPLPWRPGRSGYDVGLTLETGTPHIRCAVEDGVALMQARRRKERTYHEPSGAHGRARLVVLACEVGGRWSSETQAFLRQLVKAKTRHVPPALRTSAKLAWLWRWSTILACASARAFAVSLLEGTCHSWHDGPTPTTDGRVHCDDSFLCKFLFHKKTRRVCRPTVQARPSIKSKATARSVSRRQCGGKSGSVPLEGALPRIVRHQRCSPLNVRALCWSGSWRQHHGSPNHSHVWGCLHCESCDHGESHRGNI